MFYEDAIGDKLRFGDVVRGFLSTTPVLNRPSENNLEPYTIEVDTALSVVVDPCCNIGNGTISIAPLVRTLPYFWDNPHLFKDITEINREVQAKDLMNPMQWNKFSDDEKIQILNSPKGYGFKNFFIYQDNPNFEEYDITRKSRFEEIADPKTRLPTYNEITGVFTFKTRCHMIDFKNIRHVNCKKVVESEKAIDEEILGSIVLQLSDATRAELRNKMGYYFARNPEENSQ